MNPKDFQSSDSGRCLKTPQGYWAFVPNPLPPKIQATWGLTGLLSQADRALSELAGVGQILPNPHLLIQPAIRREAVLSSRIEGTQASLSDLFYFEAGAPPENRPGDVREVANYVRALEHGLASLKRLPLSGRLVREIHEHLMRGVRGGAAAPGQFRKTQNWIGPAGCTLNSAAFVPPPVELMHQAMSDLEKYLHRDAGVPPLIQCALVHYQFEAIHPFIDGNGRVGRLLTTLFLCERGILPSPLLYLSAYFERHRQAYYDRLLAVSQKGAWHAWLEFFLRGLAEQSREALLGTKRLLALRARIQEAVRGKRIPAAALRLADHVFENPVVSAAALAKRWNMSYPSVMKGITHLVKQGFLRESTGKQRGRLFVCGEVFKMLSGMDSLSKP